MPQRVSPQWAHLVAPAKPGDRPIADDLTGADSDMERDQAFKALNLIRQSRPQLSIIPIVQNLDNEKWESGLLAKMVADEASRQNLISALSTFVEQNKFAGVCIDFEEALPETQPNLLTFMQELHAAFQQRGWLVVQSVPFDDQAWKYKDYAAATDYLLLMAYDEHYASKESGSSFSLSDTYPPSSNPKSANHRKFLGPIVYLLSCGRFPFSSRKRRVPDDPKNAYPAGI